MLGAFARRKNLRLALENRLNWLSNFWAFIGVPSSNVQCIKWTCPQNVSERKDCIISSTCLQPIKQLLDSWKNMKKLLSTGSTRPTFAAQKHCANFFGAPHCLLRLWDPSSRWSVWNVTSGGCFWWHYLLRRYLEILGSWETRTEDHASTTYQSPPKVWNKPLCLTLSEISVSQEVALWVALSFCSSS